MTKKIAVLFLGIVGIAALSVLIYKDNANFLLYGLAAFLTTIILTALLVLLVALAKKAKTSALSSAGKGPDQKSVWGKVAVTAVVIIVFAGFAMWAYNLISSYMYPKVPQARVVAELPICAESYDFSSAKVADVVEMSFRTDCRTAVKLPFCTTPIIDPDAKVKIRFMNGTEVIDGPGPEYQNWVKYKPGNESFMIYGLSQSGTAKISIDRKS